MRHARIPSLHWVCPIGCDAAGRRLPAWLGCGHGRGRGQQHACAVRVRRQLRLWRAASAWQTSELRGSSDSEVRINVYREHDGRPQARGGSPWRRGHSTKQPEYRRASCLTLSGDSQRESRGVVTRLRPLDTLRAGRGPTGQHPGCAGTRLRPWIPASWRSPGMGRRCSCRQRLHQRSA